jgi:hypothetical protein
MTASADGMFSGGKNEDRVRAVGQVAGVRLLGCGEATGHGPSHPETFSADFNYPAE